MSKSLNRWIAQAGQTILDLFGLPSFRQSPDEVLVRAPKDGRYREAESAENVAQMHWEFAAMSENAYQEARSSAQERKASRKRKCKPLSPTAFRQSLNYSKSFDEAAFKAAYENNRLALPLTGWRRWDFPSPELQAKMLGQGMYMEVLERKTPSHTIAVVFEGTNFLELQDWIANLRWLLRFIPGKDQYVVAAQDIAREFHEFIASPQNGYKLNPSSGDLQTSEGKPILIFATGHSLGGGLAQHFAYTIKQPNNRTNGPRVNKVFAFDTSPVTGWFSAPDPPRTYNATGLVIHRVFEHGEILAYFRLLTSRLAIKRENPEIWEYRYNFVSDSTVIGNHSMRRLAYGLIQAAKPWK